MVPSSALVGAVESAVRRLWGPLGAGDAAAFELLGYSPAAAAMATWRVPYAGYDRFRAALSTVDDVLDLPCVLRVTRVSAYLPSLLRPAESGGVE